MHGGYSVEKTRDVPKFHGKAALISELSNITDNSHSDNIKNKQFPI